MIENDLKCRALKVEEDHRRGVKNRDDYTENMALYFDYISKGSCESIAHSYAFRIQDDEIKREIIESLLLTDADPEDIKEFFGIETEIIAIYEELFFDKSSFMTKLDKISYITNYENSFGKELKIRSLNLGPEFIYFKFANLVPKTDSQRKIVKQMFMASAYRAMEANYNPINSNISKASLQWAQTMMKSYEAIEKLMTEDVGDGHNLVKIFTKRELSYKQEIEDSEEIL